MSLALFEEAQNRIRSMSLLHERLYQTEDLKNIDVNAYFVSLVQEVVANNKVNQKVEVNIQAEGVALNSKTLAALGLMVNEIVSNSLKHAFKGRKNNQIYLKMNPLDEVGKYFLGIGDNGIGVSEEQIFTENQSMGAELIQIFVEQLEGVIHVESDNGTHYSIVFSEIYT